LYIRTQDELDCLLDSISNADLCAIDTEFIHDSTYYPRLCLLQIATENCEAIIDPFADLNLETLTGVFTDKNIMKVFHAGDQDRQIIYRLIHTPVRPIFDLQYAVMLLGQSQQMSLARIVRLYCDTELDKGESYSDWSFRPLSESQISYAIDDVRYLPAVYKRILKDLSDCGRLEWLTEDFRGMEDVSLYEIDDNERWKKLKGLTSLKPNQLSTARELCAWRERTARDRDIPRKWVLPDDLLVQICKNSPNEIDDLKKIRGLKRYLRINQLNAILDLSIKSRNQPPPKWPLHDPMLRNETHLTAKLDLMNALVHLRSKELQIASVYLANQEELLRLALGERSGLDVLSGWRSEYIGNDLISLLEGKLSLYLEGDDLKVTLLSHSASTPAL